MTRRAFIAATWRTVLRDAAVVIAFIYTAALGLHVALGIAKDVLG